MREGFGYRRGPNVYNNMLARPINTVDDTQPIDTRREILLLLGTFPQTSWKTLGWLVRRVYLGGVLNKTGLSAARTTGNKNFVMGVTFQSRGFALLVTE